MATSSCHRNMLYLLLQTRSRRCRGTVRLHRFNSSNNTRKKACISLRPCRSRTPPASSNNTTPTSAACTHRPAGAIRRKLTQACSMFCKEGRPVSRHSRPSQHPSKSDRTPHSSSDHSTRASHLHSTRLSRRCKRLDRHFKRLTQPMQVKQVASSMDRYLSHSRPIVDPSRNSAHPSPNSRHRSELRRSIIKLEGTFRSHLPHGTSRMQQTSTWTAWNMTNGYRRCCKALV